MTPRAGRHQRDLVAVVGLEEGLTFESLVMVPLVMTDGVKAMIDGTGGLPHDHGAHFVRELPHVIVGIPETFRIR